MSVESTGRRNARRASLEMISFAQASSRRASAGRHVKILFTLEESNGRVALKGPVILKKAMAGGYCKCEMGLFSNDFRSYS